MEALPQRSSSMTSYPQSTEFGTRSCRRPCRILSTGSQRRSRRGSTARFLQPGGLIQLTVLQVSTTTEAEYAVQQSRVDSQKLQSTKKVDLGIEDELAKKELEKPRVVAEPLMKHREEEPGARV